LADDDILLEKVIVGGAIRVAAVCAATGVEVVFIAPAHASDLAIEQLALAKLARAKAARESGHSGADSRAPRTRRGVIV
jgi:hypothetical protein